MHKISILLLFTLIGLGCYAQNSSTKVTNPVMWADVPDMSITRTGKDFYLISTTMHLMA